MSFIQKQFHHNSIIRKNSWLTVFLWVCSFSVFSQSGFSSKILLIPLDDRPPCLQFPVRMGLIGDVEIITPPRGMLGRFLDFGKSDEIIAWISSQDLPTLNAAIISVDMLAYGGLVASRVHESTYENALKRAEFIKIIREKAPKIKIYGSSVIMRLAPTGDGKNEAYREKLSKWAEVSPDENQQSLTEKLESEIPQSALQNYKSARERNLKINLFAAELTKNKVFDYLILSQDDAKPKGVHIKDRAILTKFVEENKLNETIAIQPGADEVSMLLLARSMTDKYNYHPKIKTIYSSENMANSVMPFEDRPLRQTVSFHLKAIGAIEVSEQKQADICFFVFTSRKENGRGKSFANEIITFSKKQENKELSTPLSHGEELGVRSQGIIITDIDPIGDIQGGDIPFTEALKSEAIFSKTYGYASWNTAGNAIGTALPHGILYGVSREIIKNTQKKELIARMNEAQTWFILNRLLDDYAYHSIVRPLAGKMIKANNWNAFRLTDEQTQVTEKFCAKELRPIAEKTVQNFNKKKTIKLINLYFYLPWNRTFEAEINSPIQLFSSSGRTKKQPR